jgi:hypothetical protein
MRYMHDKATFSLIDQSATRKLLLTDRVSVLFHSFLETRKIGTSGTINSSQCYSAVASLCDKFDLAKYHGSLME